MWLPLVLPGVLAHLHLLLPSQSGESIFETVRLEADDPVTWPINSFFWVNERRLARHFSIGCCAD